MLIHDLNANTFHWDLITFLPDFIIIIIIIIGLSISHYILQ